MKNKISQPEQGVPFAIRNSRRAKRGQLSCRGLGSNVRGATFLGCFKEEARGRHRAQRLQPRCASRTHLSWSLGGIRVSYFEDCSIKIFRCSRDVNAAPPPDTSRARVFARVTPDLRPRSWHPEESCGAPICRRGRLSSVGRWTSPSCRAVAGRTRYPFPFCHAPCLLTHLAPPRVSFLAFFLVVCTLTRLTDADEG